MISTATLPRGSPHEPAFALAIIACPLGTGVLGHEAPSLTLPLSAGALDLDSTVSQSVPLLLFACLLGAGVLWPRGSLREPALAVDSIACPLGALAIACLPSGCWGPRPRSSLREPALALAIIACPVGGGILDLEAPSGSQPLLLFACPLGAGVIGHEAPHLSQSLPLLILPAL
jgi:hypothetical protein